MRSDPSCSTANPAFPKRRKATTRPAIVHETFSRSRVSLVFSPCRVSQLSGPILDLKAAAVRSDAGFSQELKFFDPLLPLFVQFIHCIVVPRRPSSLASDDPQVREIRFTRYSVLLQIVVWHTHY